MVSACAALRGLQEKDIALFVDVPTLMRPFIIQDSWFGGRNALAVSSEHGVAIPAERSFSTSYEIPTFAKKLLHCIGAVVAKRFRPLVASWRKPARTMKMPWKGSSRSWMEAWHRVLP